MHRILTLLALLGLTAAARAEVKTEVVEYEYQGTKLKGFLAYNPTLNSLRPGVLVVHEWWGLNDYAKGRAKALAEMGYVAFCPDMYGDGRVTEHPQDAGKMAGEVRDNVKVWRGRAAAGLKQLAMQKMVDPHNLAAIGYCFGGSTALELAYTGADLKAVATFHAGLPPTTAEDAKAIKAKILICNGADDKFIPAAAIKSFQETLAAAKVDLDFQNYPGAVHSFTVKEADVRKLPGMAYNQAADEASWKAMQELFKKAFAK